MAEGVLGLQLFLESQQHSEVVGQGAGGTPGKTVTRCHCSHAVLALSLKVRPKPGVFTLL